MKKLLCFLSAALLLLSSCTNENPTNTTEAPVLLKKMISTSADGAENILTYAYDGNKIQSITSSLGMSREYFYTGDLITSMKTYKDGTLYSSLELTYEGNKLSQEIDDSGKSVFTHNTDGTISQQGYYMDLNTNVETLAMSNMKYYYANGNRVKDEWFKGNDKVGSTVTTFDDENDPFANVIGLDKLLNNGRIDKNNTLTRTTESDYEDETIVTNTYKYNGKGFPIECTSSSVQGSEAPIVTVNKYFYE